MIEPGARLADRYRLDEPVSESGGAMFWKATDETLARLVAIWTFPEEFPRTGEVVRAARATSRVADSRVTQIFDADDTAPTPYVVEEWVIGQSLRDMLAHGPLDPERAAGLVAEAAETLATASETGLFHQHLTPNKLIWSVGGAVKVTGIGVDSALRGVDPERPALVDARGLGVLLYAALTAHWPDVGNEPGVPAESFGLPPAPLESGVPSAPGRIRAGIPERLDEIVRRSALQSHGHSGPLTTPREVADALSDIPRVVPLPVTPAGPSPAPPPHHNGGPPADVGTPTAGASATGNGVGTSGSPPASPRPAHRPTGGRAAPGSPTPVRLLIGGVALLLFVGVVVGAWTLGTTMGGPDDPGSPGGKDQPGDGKEKEKLSALEPQGAKGFDPEGGDGAEHNDKAKNAIDGDPSTQWRTEGYNSAEFGGLKGGVGLIIDMGDPVEVHEANLNLGGAGSADIEILVGDEPEMGSLQKAGEAKGAKGETDVKLSDPAKGTYVCVWFTHLPEDGKYRGAINQVELRGKT